MSFQILSHIPYFTTGIGREIAIELIKKGSKVVALSRTQHHLDTLKREVCSYILLVLLWLSKSCHCVVT